MIQTGIKYVPWLELIARRKDVFENLQQADPVFLLRPVEA